MIQSITGWIHTLVACTALLSGLVVFLRPQATVFHKAMGYVYSSNMAVLIVTAFFIYHLTKSFNALHVAAILSCPPLIGGLSAAITRRPKGSWRMRHYFWMGWSYIGLWAAFVAEIATRILRPYLILHFKTHPGTLFWVIVGVASVGVTVAGWHLVERNRKLVTLFQKHF